MTGYSRRPEGNEGISSKQQTKKDKIRMPNAPFSPDLLEDKRQIPTNEDCANSTAPFIQVLDRKDYARLFKNITLKVVQAAWEGAEGGEKAEKAEEIVGDKKAYEGEEGAGNIPPLPCCQRTF